MAENAGKPNNSEEAANEAYRLMCERDEKAIELLEKLYAKLLKKIAGTVLRSKEDVEEVVNDALHDLWRGDPPEKPEELKAHAAAVCRRRAIDRLRTLERKKRRADFTDTAEELEEIFTDGFEDSAVDSMVIKDVLNSFVRSLDERDRTVFMKRFFLSQTPAKIELSMGISRDLVYVRISRMREKLKKELERNL